MTRRPDVIRLATRGSALAMAQARSIAYELERRRYDVELIEVETTGDQIRDELIHRLGTTGAFVRALDERVLDGTVEAAVHSMKDVPTEAPDELLIAAVPERGPANDVLVTPDGASIDALATDAIIGTSSLRRRAQLKGNRPDLRIQPLRGNVDTRVEKVLAPALIREEQRRREATMGTAESADSDDDATAVADENEDAQVEDSDEKTNSDSAEGEKGEEGEDVTPVFERTVDEWRASLSEIERAALERGFDESGDGTGAGAGAGASELDAIVLSKAGLERIELLDQLETTDLPIDRFVPAPGQGAIAVSMVEGELVEPIRAAIDHPRTRVEVTVERTILSELGGGCIAPLGVHAVTQGEYVHTVVGVYDRDGTEQITTSRDLPITEYRSAARDFADELAEQGAADLIETARRRAGENHD